MRGLLFVVIFAVCLGVAPGLASADCFDFNFDPGLFEFPNIDGSYVHYIDLQGNSCDAGVPCVIPDGDVVSFDFMVTAYQYTSLGQSSVMGPIPCGTLFAEFRFNFHYDSPEPSVSVYTTAGGLPAHRYTIALDQAYHASIARAGTTLVLNLFEEGSPSPVFTDTLPFDWDSCQFEWFQLAYDYYTSSDGDAARPGGYCVYNATEQRVDFRADRGDPGVNEINFVEGWIDNLCINGPDCPIPVERTTWGRLRTMY